MNTDAIHFPEQFLENYARGECSEQETAPLEEHLLLCMICRDKLQEIGEYLEIARAACESTIRKPPSVSLVCRRKSPPPRASAELT